MELFQPIVFVSLCMLILINIPYTASRRRKFQMPYPSSGDKAVNNDSFNYVYYFVIQPSCSVHLELTFI